MKQTVLIFFNLIFLTKSSFCQIISVANEKENTVTVGLANPIKIAVENTSSKDILVKCDNGIINGSRGSYVLTPNRTGLAIISIFKKVGNTYKKIGESNFRAKPLWDPVFRIGSGNSYMTKVELANQQFVRAELLNSDFDLKFTVDSFKVCVISSDTCRYTELKNIGNKLNEQIINLFQTLHANDTVIFKDIYCSGLGPQRKIAPVLIFISN